LNWILNYDIVWCTIGHRAQYIGHNFSYLKGSRVIHEGPSHHEEMGTSGTEKRGTLVHARPLLSHERERPIKGDTRTPILDHPSSPCALQYPDLVEKVAKC
jgi:hypothetical protein